MHDHEQLIHRLYSAFGERDGQTMTACYHHDAVFSDPVFRHLEGDAVGAMWRMLTGRAEDLAIEHRDVWANDSEGGAHWDATYTFGRTGRKVFNRIDARFRFRDGLIVEHHDQFDLWRWMRMALGAKGVLLGWLPPVQAAVSRQALVGLHAFRSREAELAEEAKRAAHRAAKAAAGSGSDAEPAGAESS